MTNNFIDIKMAAFVTTVMASAPGSAVAKAAFKLVLEAQVKALAKALFAVGP